MNKLQFINFNRNFTNFLLFQTNFGRNLERFGIYISSWFGGGILPEAREFIKSWVEKLNWNLQFFENFNGNIAIFFHNFYKVHRIFREKLVKM